MYIYISSVQLLSCVRLFAAHGLKHARPPCRAPEGVCLAGPVPEEDLQRFRREFRGNPPERFLPAALDRKGGMTVDFDRLGEVLR